MKLKILVVALIYVLIISCSTDDGTVLSPSSDLPDELPRVELATFMNSTVITNMYYGPDESKLYIYEGGEVGKDPEEEIRIERGVSSKVVMGIECIIHHDVVFEDGILIEDTDDWLAQDDDGNLWYFGEFVENFDDDDSFLDNEGSWESGVDGALPGYWMPINPVVGQKYYQEYYENEAEDYAEVLAVGETVTIDMGTFENCLVTKDVNPFEEGVYENKYYAPEIGFIKEEKFEDGELVESVELVEIVDL